MNSLQCFPSKGGWCAVAVFIAANLAALPASAVAIPGMLKERTFRVVFVSSNHGAGRAAEEKADAAVRYTGKPRSVSVSLADIGFSGPVKVRDLWNHQDLGAVAGTLT